MAVDPMTNREMDGTWMEHGWKWEMDGTATEFHCWRWKQTDFDRFWDSDESLDRTMISCKLESQLSGRIPPHFGFALGEPLCA